MSEQENIQIVRRLIDNLNNHNLDASVQFFANDVRTEATSSPGLMSTREQSQAYTQLFLDAFPDLHFDVKDMIAQGSKVALSWTAKGTNSAALRTPVGDSIPATNKRISIPGCTIYEFRNDLVSRQDIYWDQVALLTQLEIPLEMVRTTQSGRGMT